MGIPSKEDMSRRRPREGVQRLGAGCAYIAGGQRELAQAMHELGRAAETLHESQEPGKGQWKLYVSIVLLWAGKKAGATYWSDFQPSFWGFACGKPAGKVTNGDV